MRSWLASCSLFLAVAAPSPSSEAHEDEATIRALLDRFVAAFNAGHAEAAALVYTDPHIDVNAAVPLESRAKTAASFKRLFERFDVELRVTSDEIVVTGDWALQRGEFEKRITPKGGGEPQTFTRRYIEVLKRQSDGGWLVHWGMDGPLARTP